MSIQIVVVFDVVPERFDMTVDAFGELARRTSEEPGALRFDAYVSAEKANTVVLVEEWADQNAIDLHMKEDCVRDFLAKVDGAFRGEPAVHRLSSIDA